MKQKALNDPDPIEELLLLAYPNPKRKGCPDRSVLEDLGNLRVADDHPAWEHVWHCSPCFAEFKAVRDGRWARERRKSERKKRIAATGTLVALAIIGCLIFAFSRTPSRQNVPAVAVITLDLYNAEIFRGAAPTSPIDLPPIPRKIDELHIILPRFSEPGGYTIAVLRSRDNSSAVALASGTAARNHKKMEITVRLDLRKVSPGKYWLGTRHDADQIVHYYPLKIPQ